MNFINFYHRAFMKIFSRKYIFIFVITLLGVQPKPAYATQPIGCIQNVIENASTSAGWSRFCAFLIAVGRMVHSCDSYKGHTFDDSPTRLSIHELSTQSHEKRVKLIFLTCLQLSAQVISMMSPWLEELDPCEKDSYDLCHDQPDGTVQCCTIHDNTFITCCRFDAQTRTIVCGNIFLEENQSLQEQYVIGPNNRVMLTDCQDQYALIRVNDSRLPGWKIQNELGEIATKYEVFLDRYAHLDLDCYPALQEAVNHVHTIIQMPTAVSLSVITNSPTIIDVFYRHQSKKVYFSGGALQQPYAVFLGILAHEMGHAKQDYNFLQKLLIMINREILQNSFFLILLKNLPLIVAEAFDSFEEKLSFMRRWNFEINADIYGVLINKNAFGIAQGVLQKYAPYAYWEQSEISSTPHCVLKGSDPYYHPEALTCRIPLMLLLAEKYQELDQTLEERFELLR